MPTCTSNVASENYGDYIFQHDAMTLNQLAQLLGSYCFDYINSEFAIVYIPRLPNSAISMEEHSYNSIPKLYSLLDTSSIESSGILTTFNQPALSTRGSGCLVGIIDTGIDYQNPLFRRSDGTTRIAGLWDQTLPAAESGEIPQGFPGYFDLGEISYGTSYTRSQINEALASDNPLSIVPSVDENGHGTFVAGIAAGGESPDGSFSGAAPLADLAIVKLKPAKKYLKEFYRLSPDVEAYQENDIMTAIKYLINIAGEYKVPLTFCITLGTNLGGHQGSTPLSYMLRTTGRYSGVVSVVAAGNEAGLSHHYLGTIGASESYKDVELRVGPSEYGFTIELWASEPDLYTVGFISPSGEIVSQLPITGRNDVSLSFILDSTIITVNYISNERYSGSQLIFIRFSNPSAGLWRIRVYSSINLSGTFNMWLPVDKFISSETVFLQANPFTTITDPGNALNTITTSTYNHINDSIYIHSSRGYTRIENIKPDIAAPGVNVLGPGLSVSGSDYPFVRKTGSSIAAAHTAGAVANILSWAVLHGRTELLNSASIKAALIRGAERNPMLDYPNREWGYGTLDLYNAFLQIR